MKKADDFKTAAKEKGIIFWPVHNCSICDYECGFLFYEFPGNDVVYDHGCHCTWKKNFTAQAWDDVAKQYNIQGNKKVMQEYAEFWGFEIEDKPRIVLL